ncbi:hypothetical protein [Mucilaginibacter sp. UR6-11]|uniref:hypothetical protein n=1 Tax=Mucilaginibacter sp. UR6-11 TaxID=1435644 RepID=UPI001E4BFB37|nr:hypothetical protein [Mucilaginibacter sp. UR6-11]MCC8426294.1 hypothetical protein [Mucilaginibacter sp. UR6-11]
MNRPYRNRQNNQPHYIRYRRNFDPANKGKDLPNHIDCKHTKSDPDSIKTVNANVNIVEDKKWTKTEKIALGALVVSIFVFWFTYRLFVETKKANDTTSKALAHQIKKDSIDSISDAVKLGRDTLFINKQKSGIDAQIAEFKESQKEFKAINTPFIQLKVNNVSMLTNPTRVDIAIINISQIPIKTTENKCYLIIKNEKNVVIKKIINNIIDTNDQLIKEMGVNTAWIWDYDVPDDIQSKFRKGLVTIYVDAVIKYQDLINKSMRTYHFKGQLIYNAQQNNIYNKYLLNDNHN